MIYSHIKKLRLFRTLLYRFNNISMHRKIVLTYFFFFFLLVGILTAAVYVFTSSSIHRQNAFSLKQNFNQANSYLSYKLNTVISASDMLIFNASLNTILNKDFENYSALEQNADSRTILHLLKNMEESDDISRACIYVPDRLSYADNNINICPFSQAEASPWWDQLFSRKGQNLFVSNDDASAVMSEKTFISLLRAMYRKEDYSQVSFILRLDIPLESIESILESANHTSDSITFLKATSGNIIASSAFDTASSWTAEQLLPLSAIPENEVSTLLFQGNKTIVLQSPVKNTAWSMVTLVPYSSFNMAISSLIHTILTAAALILLLAWFLSKPIAYTITKRINILCSCMQKTRNGSLTEISGTIYRDEVGMLYETYNFMISKIRTLMEENRLMEHDLRIAEYEALQSQINPHFLYNTLDMISWLSYQNKSKEISSVVYSLAKFYKLSLNKGKSIISLNDELSHVKYYMEIQNLRFYGSINFQVTVDPYLLQFSIPKITLQPIVENALFHGILKKESRQGNICLTGTLEENCISLQIRDDGIGIPPDRLSRLLQPGSDANENSSESHYGLNNVNKRIKIQYGPDYGLSIESIPGNFTTVHILLPAVSADEV